MRYKLRRLVASALVAVTAVPIATTPAPVEAQSDTTDWLDYFNRYRAASGLAPVTVNRSWDEGQRLHSCYMTLNGVGHDEDPSKPGYSEAGREAGLSSNVTMVSHDLFTRNEGLELFLTAPFHAMGMMNPNLKQTSLGECVNTTPRGNRVRGIALNVIRGIANGGPPRSPVLFPGPNTNTRLDRFVAETPSPVTECKWSGQVGLPIFALMPRDVTWASASLSSPDGSNSVCVLHARNVSDPTARAILEMYKGVVVVPRRVLAPGKHTVRLSTNAGNVNWSFKVDPGAAFPGKAPKRWNGKRPERTVVGATNLNFTPIRPQRIADTRRGRPTTRLQPNRAVKIKFGGKDVNAIQATLTAVAAQKDGHIVAWDCGTVPDASSLNFSAGKTTANNALLPAKNGYFCVRSTTAVDLVVDLYGTYSRSGKQKFNASQSYRVADSRRNSSLRLRAGKPVKFAISGSSGATAAMVNLTAVRSARDGHVSAHLCGQKPTTSNLNFRAGGATSNSAVVPLGKLQKFCLTSSTDTDIVIDAFGKFSPTANLRLTSLRPVRVYDSRLIGPERIGVIKIKVAGRQGIPRSAKAASINLTAVGPTSPTHLTAYPCDQAKPQASNLNTAPGEGVISNAATVQLSRAGELCIEGVAPVHVIVDVNGVWR